MHLDEHVVIPQFNWLAGDELLNTSRKSGSRNDQGGSDVSQDSALADNGWICRRSGGATGIGSAIAAHAHYIGKDLYGYAILPDGRRQELLRIKKWNFNMQDSYTYKTPVPLPKGTTLHMEFRYDNSEHNPMNPSSPPKRALYGDNSTDEMGELVLQLRVHTAADAQTLQNDYNFFKERGLVGSSITVEKVMDRSFAEEAVRILGPYRPR